MKPLISIIIPTYNRAHLIKETLDSVLAQTYSNWECIVVDDDSSDDTVAVLKTYCKKDARFQYHKRPKNTPKGANACRNFGFELSEGKYIKWFDSDDILESSALEVQQLNFNKTTDVCVCKINKVDNTFHSKRNQNNIIPNRNIIEEYFTGIISFYVSGPLWNRLFLEKQELLFDEAISNLDDWDFNLRMLYHNPNIKYVNTSLIQYRIHNNSLSKEIEKLNFNEIKSEIKAREKHINLIKQNGMADVERLNRSIKGRYKHFLRHSLLLNDPHKFYYLYKLNKVQLKLMDFKGIVKCWIGFITYSLFKKGYRFVK